MQIEYICNERINWIHLVNFFDSCNVSVPLRNLKDVVFKRYRFSTYKRVVFICLINGSKRLLVNDCRGIKNASE